MRKELGRAIRAFALTAVLTPFGAHAQAVEQPAVQKVAPPLRLQVTYAGGPQEVLIVRRDATTRAVAAQAVAGAITLAAFGKAHFQGFSKEELAGDPLPDVRDGARVAVPLVQFAASLEKQANAKMRFMVSDNKNFEHPLVVEGGARLIYETLAGQGDELFRLRVSLVATKRKEAAHAFSRRPTLSVDCNSLSDVPLPLSAWAENDYEAIRVQVDKALATCEARILSALPQLLRY